MSEIHQEPEEISQPEGYGTVERALAGHFCFSIGNILDESWARTKGNKGVVWLAFVIIVVISMVGNFVITKLYSLVGLAVETQPAFSTLYILPNFVFSPILMAVLTTPLSAGIWMLSLKIATDQPRTATEVLNYFPKAVNLFLTYLAVYTLVLLGFCFFILPGIYLSVAYFLALPLVVEKNMGVWQAMETSRKAINHVWFSVFGLFILFFLMFIAGIFTLFIGYIWLIPMVTVSYGIIYRIVFGLEKSVVVEV